MLVFVEFAPWISVLKINGQALEPIKDENDILLNSSASISSEFLDKTLSPLEAQRRDILLSNVGTFQSRKVLMERHAQSSAISHVQCLLRHVLMTNP
jgi:hypothetical protein